MNSKETCILFFTSTTKFIFIFFGVCCDTKFTVITAAPSWIIATKAWATAGLLIEEAKNSLLSLELCRPQSAYSVRKMKFDGEKINAVIRELQVRFPLLPLFFTLLRNL